MKTVVPFRFHPSALVLGVMVFLVSQGISQAQRQGSRPIEFSEPRDTSGQRTNDQDFGNERRRLSDLEDRLSKTFNFFESDDSMSGAPAPRLPRRTTVSTRSSKAKGIFDAEEQWESTDPLARLRELLESDGSPDSSVDPDRRGGREEAEPDLLEFLKRDDWLVRGTLDDSFWGVPLEVDEKKSERSPWDASQQAEMRAHDDIRPRLEGFLGQKRADQSPFGTRLPGSSSFAGADAYELGRASRAAMEARREDYRALMGLAINQVADAPTTTRNVPQFSSRYAPPTATSPGFRSENQRSPYPLGAADRSSLYPTAPTAPQRPSVYDPIQVEVPVNTASPAADVLANPFYEQPQRRF